MRMVSGEKLLTVKEVAVILGLHQGTVYQYLTKGIDRPMGRVFLRAVKLGRYRIPESAVREFLESLGMNHPVDFTGEQKRRERDREEAGVRVRKRLGID